MFKVMHYFLLSKVRLLSFYHSQTEKRNFSEILLCKTWEEVTENVTSWSRERENVTVMADVNRENNFK